MLVTLDEIKNYLRVDFEEDDELLTHLIESSTALCMDIARITNFELFSKETNSKIAVMYSTAYLYEHREEADHTDLTLTLRSLLFGVREESF